MLRRGVCYLLSIACLTMAHPAAAELRAPGLFTDHAVLQRGKPIHVWGTATPGSEIRIALHRQQAQGIADTLGKWDVWLAPEVAGGPYELTISGDGSTMKAQDVMIGDVWIASGQSNMEMPLVGFGAKTPVIGGDAAIAAANDRNVRFLRVAHKASTVPSRDVPQGWVETTPSSARFYSAVAYFFAREIAAREKTPVGIIQSTWSGTPAESWISSQAFAGDPALQPVFAARAKFEVRAADRDLEIAAYKQRAADARARGLPAPSVDLPPQEEMFRPSALYNGMIAPLTGYGIKGVIWYQGEGNSDPDRAPHYEAVFRGLIADWRTRFAQGDFPFLYAQISSFDTPGQGWGPVRDAQRRALSITQTAMAVTTDVGNLADIHPGDKQSVANRLARAARGLVYGRALPYQSPLYRQVTGEGGNLRVWLDHAHGLTSNGAPLLGFEIAGKDRQFVPATARIDGDSIIVTAAAFTAASPPAYVRYNWSNVASGRLFNSDGLPMGTFTSEDALDRH